MEERRTATIHATEVPVLREYPQYAPVWYEVARTALAPGSGGRTKVLTSVYLPASWVTLDPLPFEDWRVGSVGAARLTVGGDLRLSCQVLDGSGETQATFYGDSHEEALAEAESWLAAKRRES